MYYAHFGLLQAPFKITPNTDFFFAGGNRGPVLDALLYAITNGEGIIKVTGEVGSGKTMLCNMLQTNLPPQIESVYLANPSVGPEEVLHAIAFELQLGIDRNAGRLEVMHVLQDYLLERHAECKRVVLFIEESQSMPIATLEEIRLLSNLETRNDKLLQIVMFGQPELDENLRKPHIRQLRDRISHSFRLDPLRPRDVREYLMFRMRAAGYHGPDLFSRGVVTCIARASKGLTRRINLIADKALLSAYSEDTHTIRLRHVAAALRDSEFAPQPRLRSLFPRTAWLGAAMAAGAAVGAAVYAMAGTPVATSPRIPSAPMHASPGYGPALDSGANIKVAPAASSGTHQTAAAPAPPTTSIAQPPTAALPAAAAAPEVATDRAPAVHVTMNSPAGVLTDRVAATSRWLSEARDDTYSIQMLGARAESQLVRHLTGLPGSIDLDKLFIYRTTARGRPAFTVLYGAYADRGAAREALENLPRSLHANRPILRTVQGIRRELAEHAGS